MFIHCTLYTIQIRKNLLYIEDILHFDSNNKAKGGNVIMPHFEMS